MPHHTALPAAARFNRFTCLACLVSSFSIPFPVAVAQFTPGPNPIADTVGAPTLSGGTGTVNVGGTISAGSSVGVVMTGASTLNNNGTITTTSGRSIDSNSGTADLTVSNTGLIQSASSDAFRVNTAGSSVSLLNSGTIQVTAGGQAIDWASIATGTNTLTNLEGAVISAFGEDAVRPGQNGTINNAGTIFATPTGTTNPSGSDGIDLRTEKSVVVTNTGTIYGRHGIATDGANAGPSSLTLYNNAGTIYALNGSGVNIDGVSTSVTANITNAAGATIRGGVLATATEADGDGIDVDGVLTLENSGDVLGLGAKGGANNAEGIAAGGGSITNTATGRIIGSSLLVDAANGDSSRGGNGILIDDSNGGNAIAATIVTNAGLIQGKSGFGLKIVGIFGDTVTNQEGGTIRGTGAVAVLDTGDGDDEVSNAGSIVSDGGNGTTAVSLGGGNDTFTISGANATVTGGIDGGAGTNTLTFNLGATDRTFSHGGSISNFSTVEIVSGQITLSGVSTYTGVTNIEGGALFVEGSLGDTAVRVSDGATLGGRGMIGGLTTIESGGALAPGASPGTIEFEAGLTLLGGAVLNFELGSSGNLLLISGGTLTGPSDGLVTLNIFDAGDFTAGTYTLFDFAGAALSGFDLADFDFGSTLAGYDYALAFDGDTLQLTASAIPEPSTYAVVVGTFALGAMMWRRRAR